MAILSVSSVIISNLKFNNDKFSTLFYMLYRAQQYFTKI